LTEHSKETHKIFLVQINMTEKIERGKVIERKHYLRADLEKFMARREGGFSE
jgi:hypothetical protein